MTTPVPYDDLRPDMWVTIRDVPEDDPAVSPFDGHAEAMGRLRRRRRPVSRPGVPLRVLSVDLPFLYLAVLDGDGDEVGPVILDVREQPIVAIDESVADAIVAFGHRKRQDAQSRCLEMAERAAELEAATEAARRRNREQAGVDPDEADEAAERRRRNRRRRRDQRPGDGGEPPHLTLRRLIEDLGDAEDADEGDL